MKFLHAQRPERLPVVLGVEEVRVLLDGMASIHRVLAELLYGSGLRILECCRLRVKDVDFARPQILVRDGKQELGMGDCQLRDGQGQTRHMYLVMFVNSGARARTSASAYE